MKLKTLKDLDHPIIDQVGREVCTRTGLVDTNELREEAIKWVKKYEDAFSDWAEGKKDFIKEFFNITEEDLNG